MIDIFVKDAIKAHGSVYNYDKTKYIDESTIIEVECTINNHGVFKTLPINHLNGERCPKCKYSTRKTNEQCITDFNKKHRGLYDYSLVTYLGNKIPIQVICKIHGVFDIRPDSHLKGHGCSECANNIKKTNISYINEANIIHKNLYDYSKLVYLNNKTPITIICKIHGDFSINPSWHLRGGICNMCEINSKKTHETYIKQVSNIHTNLYIYSKTKYKTARDSIIITCPIHGDFTQIARDHLSGHGCKKCNKSQAEIKIMKWLENNNIIYEDEKSFNECRNKRKLLFDFYLPNYNTIIEYDGIQHFKPIEHFGGLNRFEIVKQNDSIKDKYCKDNNIKLLRIPHWDLNNIENILKNKIEL